MIGINTYGLLGMTIYWKLLYAEFSDTLLLSVADYMGPIYWSSEGQPLGGAVNDFWL